MALEVPTNIQNCSINSLAAKFGVIPMIPRSRTFPHSIRSPTTTVPGSNAHTGLQRGARL